MSDSAKKRYEDQARREAQERHVETSDEYDRATAEILEQNEERVFKLYYPSESNLTPLQQEAFRSAYRDSMFRCLDLPEVSLERIMDRAKRTRDRALEQAVYHESVERGLPLAQEYRDKHPEANAAWEEYVSARRRAEALETVFKSAQLLVSQHG